MSPGIATSCVLPTLAKADEYRDALNQNASPVMPPCKGDGKHLTDHIFFVESATPLLIRLLFAYTHVALEGGFDLVSNSEIQAWLKRTPQSRHISITARGPK